MLRKPPAAPKKKAVKKSNVIQKAAPAKVKSGRGGARKGAGRKPANAPKHVEPEAVPAVSKSGEDDLFNSLPLKQRNFIVNYLINGFNATKAAKKAGYSAATADSQGCRLLKDPKVRAVLDARTRKDLAKAEVTAERVLAEVAKLAFLDPRRLFTPGGNLVPIGDLGDDEAASIAGIEIVQRKDGRGKEADTITLKKIKLADKGMNLERLMRYFQMFVDRVEHSGSVGVNMIHSVPRPVRKPLMQSDAK